MVAEKFATIFINICCFLHDCMLFCEHTVNLTNSRFILGALIEQYSR